MPAVNPKILVWARETAGLTLEEAAKAIKLNDARGKTGAERLAALEAGESQPPRRLLLTMSQKYRRSLLVFYLSEPPQQGDRGQDFRSLSGERPPFDANLDTLIRDLKARQSLVKSLLEDEESPILPFIDSVRMIDGVLNVATSIISTIGFSLDEFRARKDAGTAFSYLRQCVENTGIFVLLIGDLGTHHTAISVEIFRGFALADSIAPFVIINDHDVNQAMSFTLLHEVVHLWLGTTGVSGASDELEIERFCNDVAGAILLPLQELNELRDIHSVSFEEALTQLSKFANERNLSRAMIAYNLYKSGRIEESRWVALNKRFTQDWIDSRVYAKEKKLEARSSGGPNYYVVRRHRLGRALLGLVDRSISAGTISPTKAARILGVKPRNVRPLLDNNPALRRA